MNTEAIYQQAMDKYTHYASAEDLNEAIRLFEQAKDCEGSEKHIQKCRTLIEYMVGNSVTFGSYQNKPIRWRVIDERGRIVTEGNASDSDFLKAFALIRDSIGEAPVQRVEVDTIDPQARERVERILSED